MIAKSLTILWAHVRCEWFCLRALLRDGHAPRKYVEKHSFYGTILIMALTHKRTMVTFYRQLNVRNRSGTHE